MVLPTGESPISFSQIRDEFGTAGTDSATAPVRLGQYRRDDPSFTNEDVGELTGLPLDTGIPTSGAINVDSFHGKQLNTVVDLHETGNSTYNHNVKTDRFDAGNYDFVGGYRDSLSPSTWQGGKKIIVHVNQTFGSDGASSANDVALTVGDGWPANTNIHFDLGSSAVIAGKGGNGGNGGAGVDDSSAASGDDAGNGTSALKLETGMTYNLVSGAVIVGGGGGGAGGAGASQDDSFLGLGADNNDAGGGGGGGGAGVPSGTPGEGGSGGGNGHIQAEDGGVGNATAGGEGGERGQSGSPTIECRGTHGGDGGVGEKITSAGDTAPIEGEAGDPTGGINTTGAHGSPGGESGSAIIYF